MVYGLVVYGVWLIAYGVSLSGVYGVWCMVWWGVWCIVYGLVEFMVCGVRFGKFYG